jgi:hypothetical protein
MWIVNLIATLIGLIFALILFMLLAAIIIAAVVFVKFWIEEVHDNDKGFAHKLLRKLDEM